MCSENRQFPDIQTLMNMRIFIILITCLYASRWHDFCYLNNIKYINNTVLVCISIMSLSQPQNSVWFFLGKRFENKTRKRAGTRFLKIENTVFCHYSVNSVTIFRMLSICIFPFLFNALQKAKNLYISYSYTCFPGIFQANVY